MNMDFRGNLENLKKAAPKILLNFNEDVFIKHKKLWKRQRLNSKNG